VSDIKAVRLKRPAGTLSKPYLREDELRKAVNARLVKFDEPYHIEEPGVSTGPEKMSKGEIADRFVRRLLTGDVGLHLVINDDFHRHLHGRTVETAPDSANTTGSPGVDLLVGFLNQNFAGQWEQWGIYNFKHISGSTTWSDHAYVNKAANPPWCGRAIDVHPDSVAIGDAIYAAATSEPAIKARLRYCLWRGYADHYPGHLHFSFEDAGAPGSC
jgi:hypothetical protein